MKGGRCSSCFQDSLSLTRTSYQDRSARKSLSHPIISNLITASPPHLIRVIQLGRTTCSMARASRTSTMTYRSSWERRTNALTRVRQRVLSPLRSFGNGVSELIKRVQRTDLCNRLLILVIMRSNYFFQKILDELERAFKFYITRAVQTATDRLTSYRNRSNRV